MKAGISSGPVAFLVLRFISNLWTPFQSTLMFDMVFYSDPCLGCRWCFHGRDKLLVQNVSSSFNVALEVTILVFQWRNTSGFLSFTFDEDTKYTKNFDHPSI